MSKLDGILKKLVIYTANKYGGFEGFETGDLEEIDSFKSQIQALIEKVISENESNHYGGLDYTNEKDHRNSLRAAQRQRAKEYCK